METDRARPVQMIEGSRQHVLSRVLLHVIEPPRPVDDAVRAGAGLECAFEHVRNRVIVAVDHVDDTNAVQGAGVERLSAGRGIERRPIQHGYRPRIDLFHGENGCVEFAERRFLVVEAFGHG